MDKERWTQKEKQKWKNQQKKKKKFEKIGLGIRITLFALIPILTVLLLFGVLGEATQVLGLAILMVAILWLLINAVRSIPETIKENKKRIDGLKEKDPEKYISHVNEKTGNIVLVSDNALQRWITSDESITIEKTNNSTVKTIPFSAIQSMKLKNNWLSFSILEKRQHFVANDIIEDRVESISQEPIFFDSSDFHIAQAIQDRVAGK